MRMFGTATAFGTRVICRQSEVFRGCDWPWEMRETTHPLRPLCILSTQPVGTEHPSGQSDASDSLHFSRIRLAIRPDLHN